MEIYIDDETKLTLHVSLFSEQSFYSSYMKGVSHYHMKFSSFRHEVMGI